ncbi:MAG: hypothetical protein ACOY0T_38765 [Myxococcota bacterium]
MSYAVKSNVEGTPILCKNCGGAMRLQPDLSAWCGFCGARDQLPTDEASRYLELRNRLSLARSRALQVQGMDAALARVFEDRGAFLRVSGTYLVIAGVIMLMSLVTIFQSQASFRNVPENYRMSMYMHQLFAPAMVLGIAVSLGLGLVGGRSHFRRRVRPLLLARPVQAGHAAFGCRVCGGDLPPATEPSVTCSYCNSMNLLPASQHEANLASVDQQTQALSHSVRRAHGTMVSIAARMRLIVIVGVATTFALNYALPALLDRYVFLGK